MRRRKLEAQTGKVTNAVRLIPRRVPFQNYHNDVITVFGVDTKSLSPRYMY